METKKLAIILAAVIIVIAGAAVAISFTGGEDDTPVDIPDDETIGDLVVYGNANNDTVVDQKDIQYIQDVIDKKAAKTLFSDANNDGFVDEKDIEQVRDMIAKKDGTKVWFIDAMNDVKSVEWPINRIIALSNSPQIMALSVGLDDKMVAYTKADKVLYQNWKNADLISGGATDYDLMLSYKPDAIIMGNSHNGGLEDMHDPVVLRTYEKAGVDLISVYNMEGEKSGSCGLTLGYLCDSVDQATEYYNWCKTMFKDINEKLEKIPQDKRKTGLVIFGGRITGGSVAGPDYDYSKALTAAGGICIADWKEDYLGVNDDNGTWIFKYKPDCLFRISTIGYGDIAAETGKGVKNYNALLEKYEPMPCVKEGNMFLIDFSLPQTLRIAYMAECMYPDVFGHGYGDKWHKELLDIYGIDFNVQKGQFLVTLDDVQPKA